MAENEEKVVFVHKKDIQSLDDAVRYAYEVIEKERLCNYSLSITEMTSETGRRAWYDVQLEGRVKNGEPDQERG